MSEPWWLSWSVAELSPLNAVAVVAAQLDPVQDWEETWYRRRQMAQTAQLWWLQWYARPDLREQQLNWQCLKLAAGEISIHPDTIAEWTAPPVWKVRDLCECEWALRRHAIFTCSLTAEQCRNIHPDIWRPTLIGVQAAKSTANFDLLAPMLHLLEGDDLQAAFVGYARYMHGLNDPSGAYFLARFQTVKWTYWAVWNLIETVKPLPEELKECILRNSDTEVRQMVQSL